MTSGDPPATDAGSAQRVARESDFTRDSPAGSQRDGAAEDHHQESLGSFLRELPILILVAFALAFLLRTFVVQVFYIPSSSMEPTLQVNDRILVDKVTYRFRDVRRGEIVVFEGDEPLVSEEGGPVVRTLRGLGQLIGVAPANAKDFVKRVIGLPGDTIRIDDGGVVYVNDVEIQEPYISARDPGPYGPVTVPEGTLFFLGDNRPNSSDSRESLGFVEDDHVVGKAFLTIWPLDRFHLLHSADYQQLSTSGVDRWTEGDVAAVVWHGVAATG